ncbi:MAG: HEPN domain-containing protein [Candidatus Cloacimonetes bacterium]|nr:HEPN domain-containing protein [Candidatus Cloacimonadota bacterium]
MEEKLKQIIHQWITKAENDLLVIRHELDTPNPTTDMICFHSQQAAEKYLKAFLIAYQVDFPKTHNIGHILNSCSKIDIEFSKLTDSLILTNYAVELRYPEEYYIPDLSEAENAFKLAIDVKEFVKVRLKELM